MLVLSVRSVAMALIRRSRMVFFARRELAVARLGTALSGDNRSAFQRQNLIELKPCPEMPGNIVTPSSVTKAIFIVRSSRVYSLFILAYANNTIVAPILTRLMHRMPVHDSCFVVPIFTMKNNTAAHRNKLPLDIYALFGVRLVVSAGSFVGPFLTMMLTMKLGYDEARAGVFMSIVSILSALGLVVGGKLGDKFNRPRVLRTLQATTALAYIACGLMGFTAATPFVIAFAMGVLNGTWPIINAIVADVAPADQRKESFSLLYWGNNIGFSIGPLIAGLLFTAAPRVLFFGNAVVLLAAAGIVTLFVRGATAPETASEAAGQRGTDRGPPVWGHHRPGLS